MIDEIILNTVPENVDLKPIAMINKKQIFLFLFFNKATTPCIQALAPNIMKLFMES